MSKSRFRGKTVAQAAATPAEDKPAVASVHQAVVASDHSSRRGFIGVLGAGAVAVGIGVPAVFSLRSVVPNVLYEPPQQVKLGALDSFTDGSTFIASQRMFVFREKNTFFCISARCTHLGCTVQLVNIKEAEGGFEFHCPCHGSKFRADGTNFAGPAPRPLFYYKLAVAADDGQLVADMSQPADKGWRLTV
jgi:cytochrome b6-f complex iron-sulfur subunit